MSLSLYFLPNLVLPFQYNANPAWCLFCYIFFSVTHPRGEACLKPPTILFFKRLINFVITNILLNLFSACSEMFSLWTSNLCFWKRNYLECCSNVLVFQMMQRLSNIKMEESSLATVWWFCNLCTRLLLVFQHGSPSLVTRLIMQDL